MKGMFFMGFNAQKRIDLPNRTEQELLASGWKLVDDKYINLIRGCLSIIRSELDRCYWNANQKEMNSPFDNSGASAFSNAYLTVRSYNWSNNSLPNFDTDALKVFWYKHSNRGLYAIVPNNYNIGDLLATVVNSSILSIQAQFEGDEC
jgi:hypothetical protein